MSKSDKKEINDQTSSLNNNNVTIIKDYIIKL